MKPINPEQIPTVVGATTDSLAPAAAAAAALFLICCRACCCRGRAAALPTVVLKDAPRGGKNKIPSELEKTDKSLHPLDLKALRCALV